MRWLTVLCLVAGCGSDASDFVPPPRDDMRHELDLSSSFVSMAVALCVESNIRPPPWSAMLPGPKSKARTGEPAAGSCSTCGGVASAISGSDGVAIACCVVTRALKDIDSVSLRRAVGVVFQEPYVFRGSIADNVRYGEANVSAHRIQEFAEAASIDTFANLLQGGEMPLRNFILLACLLECNGGLVQVFSWKRAFLE